MARCKQGHMPVYTLVIVTVPMLCVLYFAFCIWMCSTHISFLSQYWLQT